MAKMKDERLPKRSETKKNEGSRHMVGLCEERSIYIRQAEEEEKWREKGKQQGAMEKNNKSSLPQNDN